MLLQSSQRGEPDDPKKKAPHDLFNDPLDLWLAIKTHQKRKFETPTCQYCVLHENFNWNCFIFLQN